MWNNTKVGLKWNIFQGVENFKTNYEKYRLSVTAESDCFEIIPVLDVEIIQVLNSRLALLLLDHFFRKVKV